MAALYLQMRSSDEEIQLPASVNLSGHIIALMDVVGRIEPTPEKPIYICSDIVEESIVQKNVLPVLRCTRFDRPRINTEFVKMLYLRPRRTDVSSLRLYITDLQGRVMSFDKCRLNCTLLLIPEFKKL